MPLSKGKPLLPLPHLQMILINLCPPACNWRDDCSHVINEIRPKGSTQPKANSESLKGDSSNKGKIASQTGKYGF
jgi:hypothetical protein